MASKGTFCRFVAGYLFTIVESELATDPKRKKPEESEQPAEEDPKKQKTEGEAPAVGFNY